MKPVFLFVSAALLSTSLQAQTTLIAHKSHSGTVATFAMAEPGNFGNPPPRLIRVEKISDTAVIMTHDEWGVYQYSDTVYNHPVFSNPNIPVDSMKGMFYEKVEFKHFEQPVDAPKAAPAPKAPEKTATPEPKAEPAKRTEKRKNNLFLLWIIGGGTFLGAGLLSLKKRRKTIYA